MIAEWMEIRGVKDKVLLGFDMLKKNLEGLRKGYVSTLIAEKNLCAGAPGYGCDYGLPDFPEETCVKRQLCFHGHP